MRNTFKKEKGITLISLAVTIVVIIILAGVSINYSLESVEHSKYMAMFSEIQIVQEKVNLYESEGKVLLTTNLDANHKAILQSKGVDSSKYDNYYYFTSGALETVFELDGILGEYLISVSDRDVIGLTTINNGNQEFVNYRISDISDEYNVQAMPKLSDVASVGDYVNYDPTVGETATSVNTTYTSPKGTSTSHGNGYADQTFSAAAYKNAGGKWQILEINDDGTITLISDPIYQDSGSIMGTNGFTLSNGVGYLWAEEELHRICAIYGYGNGADTRRTIEYYYGGPNDQNGSITPDTAEAQQGRKTSLKVEGSTNQFIYTGARSITVDDINRICGKTYTANYSNGTVAKNLDSAKYYPTIGGESATGRSIAQTNVSGSYYYTYYGYEISSANGDSNIALSQTNMLSKTEAYWIASRDIDVRGGGTFCDVRYVGKSMWARSSYLCFRWGMDS